MLVVADTVPGMSGCKTAKQSTLVACDTATYNCPCVNTGIRKSTPTTSSDCPRALFIVIAKHSRIGNCLRARINDVHLP